MKSPEPVSFEEKLKYEYTKIVNAKDIAGLTMEEIEKAQGGKIAPWFDEPGGGIQFKFDKSIEELIDGDYLRRVE